MHLIDGHGPAPGIETGMDRAMGVVVPGKMIGARDDGGGRGPELAAEAEGIGLQRLEPSLAVGDLVFVDRALAHIRGEDLPEPAVDALAHLVPAPVPAVEIPDGGNPGGVGRPDGEMHPRHPLMGHGMGPQPLIEQAVGTLDQQMIVHLAEHRAEGIGIAELPDAAGIAGPQAIALVTAATRDQPLEEPVGMARGERAQCGAVLGQHLDRSRRRARSSE